LHLYFRGGDETIKKHTTGHITLSASNIGTRIEHNIGELPDLFYMIRDDGVVVFSGIIATKDTVNKSGYIYNGTITCYNNITMDATYVTNGAYNMSAGAYTWHAFKFN